ncbi:MAG TPA: tRNA pseudouridine(38-40) synthase TruA, partial [Nitrospiria bacterium]|nr:tRNA pseudouridine(38-40) synthase TruA [Nitrospiria bacterium]
GRTDSGVHAKAQVANFRTVSPMRAREWAQALNHFLPEDLAVLRAASVSPRFHARFSAIGKVYRYRILNRRIPNPLNRRFVWMFFQELDLRRMRAAARYLLGRHDFSSFRVGPPQTDSMNSARHPFCRIKELKIKKTGDEIAFLVQGDRFLRQMVRTMVGTLVEIGRGKENPSAMKRILEKKDRRSAGPTAPSRGLCLEKVLYRN